MSLVAASTERLHENAIAQTEWDLTDAYFASSPADAAIYLRRAIAHMERYGLTKSDLAADARGLLDTLSVLYDVEPVA